jgi:pyruvate kinase
MPKYSVRPDQRRSHTKIVATVGPSCATAEKLAELIFAGVDVFRINTAHGTREEHQQRVDDIRRVSRESGSVVAILVDLAGPKIRLGELPDDELYCETDAQLQFVRGPHARAPGQLTTTYEPLIDELEPGDRVMLADGTVVLGVEQVDHESATCRVVQPGRLRSRQGVNLPGVKLSVSALSPRDRDNAAWAARARVDFVGLSFVRTADDVRQLKSIMEAESSDAQVIAKIEKPEALENLEEIVRTADGVMVARGDLGVEIDIARVPVVQKQIIAVCGRFQKPVIVATQMLDSMQHSRLPTRAEATDVANAILDGTDACMLSGETAVGQYPREAVETMHRIALETEPLHAGMARHARPDHEIVDPVTAATTFHGGQLAEQLNARTIVVASAGGRSARSLSAQRLFVPTLGVSDSDAILRRMCLYWGVIPLAGAPTDDSRQLIQFVVHQGRAEGYFRSGDRIVLVAGSVLHGHGQNMVVVHELA